MKAAQIKVGGHYSARVSGHFVTVRVDAIRERFDRRDKSRTVYDVTNLKTGRKLVFQSAQKFRHEVKTEKAVADRYQGLKDGTVKPTDLTDECIAAGTEWITEADKAEVARGLADFERRTKAEEICNACPNMEPKEVWQQEQEDQVRGLSIGPNGGLKQEDEQSPPFSPTATTVGNSLTETALVKPDAQTATLPVQAAPTTSGLAAQIAQHAATAHRLTDEQQAIIAAAPNTQTLVLEAGAGCGKTSTLVELSRVLPGNGQYTAFNASLVAESKTKFPRHVACNTIHSLAFASDGRRFAHRLNGRRVRSSEVAAMLGLTDMVITGSDGEPKKLNAGMLAAQVKRAIGTFCQSADPEIALKHFPRMPGVDAEGSRANSDYIRQHLLTYAQKMWADKCDPNGMMPFAHDDYVKMWEMNNPIIGADYILLDEAQDTAPVMLSAMEKQVRRGTRLILVGDSAQQIYSWRGAINALASFPDAPRLLLSQSFRFGPVVAEVANAVLGHLEDKSPLVMRGFDRIDSQLARLDAPTAILCRTNAGAVSNLIEAIGQGKHPCLIGKTDDITSFVRAAQSLQQGRSTEHPELGCFTGWREVQAYAKTDEGEDLKLMVKLVDGFGCESILEALDNMPKEKAADLIISTAHKSKGREWSRTKLNNDFMPLEKMGDEELRLLYVAATRAQNVLDVESCAPFCGGTRPANEGWNGEGGRYSTIDLTEARRLSKELPKVESTVKEQPKPTEAPKPTYDRNVVNGNTWAKGKYGGWVVRGKPGQIGTVEVAKKDGRMSKELLKRCIWQDEKVALYEV